MIMHMYYELYGRHTYYRIHQNIRFGQKRCYIDDAIVNDHPGVVSTIVHADLVAQINGLESGIWIAFGDKALLQH